MSLEGIKFRREQIIKAMAAIDVRLAELKSQVETAKADRINRGLYPNHAGIAKTRSEIRFKGAARQLLQLELGKINREINDLEHCAREQVWERAFVNLAKAVLPNEEFHRLVAMAHEAVRAGRGDSKIDP